MNRWEVDIRHDGIGFVASVEAMTKKGALDKIREALPIELEKVIGGVIVTVYFYPTEVTMVDVRLA